MITRACISINNRCNLTCKYCHFHEKQNVIHESDMDIFKILDNIRDYIETNNIKVFKLGFVGNGETLLDYPRLEQAILYISDYLQSGKIAAYTISNGLLLDSVKLKFFKAHHVNVGISIDGIQPIHDKYRCNTHAMVMDKIKLFKSIYGKYPSMNCTVGKEVIENADETIKFFESFNNRITFSRMIGKYGITLNDFHAFLSKAMKTLDVRTGGYDCTMYGGLCGAGIDNIFYANNHIYLCGNCIDLPYSISAETRLDKIDFKVRDFNRQCCFKEVCGN